MSLIHCEECGKEISDRASVCPHCGFPVSADCEIHIKWDNMRGNTYLKTGIYVDGAFVKDMKCAEMLDYSTTPGTHRIDLFFRNKCVVSKTINIPAGQADEYIAFRQTLTGLRLIDPASAIFDISPKSTFGNLGISIGKLVKCRACGADIAKTAKRCPKCGAQQHIVALSICALLGVVVFMLVMRILSLHAHFFLNLIFG